MASTALSNLLRAIAMRARIAEEVIPRQGTLKLDPTLDPVTRQPTKPLQSPGKPEVISRPGGGEAGRRDQPSMEQLEWPLQRGTATVVPEKGISERVVEQATPAKLRTEAVNPITGEVEPLGKGRPLMDPGSDLPNIPYREGEAYVPDKFFLEGSKRPRRPDELAIDAPPPKVGEGMASVPGATGERLYVPKEGLPRTKDQMLDLVEDVKGLEKTMEELRPFHPESELEEAAEATMRVRSAKRAARIKEKYRPKTVEKRKAKKARNISAMKRGEQKYMPRGTKLTDDPGPTDIFGEKVPLSEADFRKQKIATPGRDLALPKGKEPPRTKRIEKGLGRPIHKLPEELPEYGPFTSQEQDIADLEKFIGSIRPTTAIEDIDVSRQPKRKAPSSPVQDWLFRLEDESKGATRGFTSSREPAPDVRKIPEGETGLIDPEPPVNLDRDVDFGGGRVLKRTLKETKEFEKKAKKIEGDRGRIRRSKARESAGVESAEAKRREDSLAQEMEAWEAFEEGTADRPGGPPRRSKVNVGEEFSTDDAAAADQLSDLGIEGRDALVEDVQDILDRYAITDIFEFDVFDKEGRLVLNKILDDIIGDRDFSKKISEIFTEMRAIEKALGKRVPPKQFQQLQYARGQLAIVIKKLSNGARVFRDTKYPAGKEAGRQEIIEAVKRFRTPDVKVGKQTPGIPSAIKRDPTRFNFEDFVGPRAKGQDPRGIPVTKLDEEGDVLLFESGAKEFERLGRERMSVTPKTQPELAPVPPDPTVVPVSKEPTASNLIGVLQQRFRGRVEPSEVVKAFRQQQFEGKTAMEAFETLRRMAR